VTSEQMTALRAEFKPEQIGKLPKPTKKENPKGRCKECGGWHGLPAVHLDYVGHAAVTDRLISVDPDYEFGPVLDVNKRPVKEQDGSVLHYLTIAGSTKYEWGDGPNMKEISSDAIRRCAMRFGVALDLWAKEPLAGHEDAPEPVQPQPEKPPLLTTKSQQQKIAITANDHGIDDHLRYRITRRLFGVTSSKDVPRSGVNRLLEAFVGFAGDPDKGLKYLLKWEAENLPSTAAQAIREPSEDHVLTREELEAAGQTNFDEPAIPS